jgi:ESS family glutamate:Na+ symporter
VAHWKAAIVIDLLALAILLAIAAWLRSRIPALRRVAIPDAIVAGGLGLLVGPSVLDLVPLTSAELELVVYHGFAVVFIAVGLQAPRSGPRSGAVKSLSVLIPSVAAAQALLAFAILFVFVAIDIDAHPAFGFLPMLGFAQGPGQALAIGDSWEPLGLQHGAQIGLAFAALGFACCCSVGVPLIALGRRWGWTRTPGFGEDEIVADDPEPAPTQIIGVMEPLTAQLVAIGCVYTVALMGLWGLTSLLPDGHPIAATLWGFHFIGAAMAALAARRLAMRFGFASVFDDILLARISVVAVDFTTAAALSAIALGVLAGWLVPIAVLSLAMSLMTLVVCIWVARRVFPNRPFEHAIAVFGLSTGTLPTGLALLRALDPGLRGPVARNLALGATASVPMGAPLMLGVMPFAVTLWSEDPIVRLGVPIALLAAYLVALGVAWKLLTPARLLRPLRSLWP